MELLLMILTRLTTTITSDRNSAVIDNTQSSCDFSMQPGITLILVHVVRAIALHMHSSHILRTMQGQSSLATYPVPQGAAQTDKTLVEIPQTQTHKKHLYVDMSLLA